MSKTDGLIWAYKVDATGLGREIDWDELMEFEEGAFVWVHLERQTEGAHRWLSEKSGLTELQVEALLAEETRPRATPMDEGLLLILRGVNRNPGSDPEDMVSVRLWAEAHRVITIRRRRSLALSDLRDQVVAGRGPSNVGDFVAELADLLVERMAGALSDLDENLDLIEEGVEETRVAQSRNELLELRRQAITLRRHLSPQRDALARLATERISWLGDRERLHLRESLDRTMRYVEDLESARERAAVTQEELANRTAEQMNRRMYALSIVAGLFLPLSFATGLLGINVGGIPGADTPWAFTAVCAGMGLGVIVEILLFRWLRWM
jgi:zinc transporter